MPKSSKVYVYDIETLINYQVFVFEDANSDEVVEFQFSEQLMQLKELCSFLREGHFLVGYNVLKFDGQVIQHILDHQGRWTYWSNKMIIDEVYRFSQQVISMTNGGDFPPYPEWKLLNKHLDIFTIWHFDNRAKATSLKWLQYMIDWPDLREMPIPHDVPIKASDIPDILYYCRNDVASTKAMYWITKGVTDIALYKEIDRVQLRKDVKKEFGFQDSCLNWNDVKIGDQLNMKNYFDLTGLQKRSELYDLKHKLKRNEPFTFGDCFPEYMEFYTPEFRAFVDSIRGVTVDLNDKEQYFEFKYNQTLYTIAKGGAHSNDPKRIVIPPKGWILRDADVGSMYPNALRKRRIYPAHLGQHWSDIIVSNIEKRMEAKRIYKETGEKKYQNIQDTYKLALNGGSFGKLNEKTSWQEDPFAAMQVTIGSQIDLLMLIEMLEMQGIPIISANTDGIVCLFPEELEKTYYAVCKDWERKVGNDTLGMLEYQDYTKLVQLSVNDYLAITPEGKAKKKGDFMTDFELHKNKSYRIIPLALEAYFAKGLDPEVFMRQHLAGGEKHIFDFCRGVRGRGGWYFETRQMQTQQSTLFDSVTSAKMTYAGDGERQQKTIRYYISNKGAKIVKAHPDGRKNELDAGPWLGTIMNVYKVEDYDINYNFYIEKVNNIIREVEGKNQTKAVRKKKAKTNNMD